MFNYFYGIYRQRLVITVSFHFLADRICKSNANKQTAILCFCTADGNSFVAASRP